MTHERCLVLDSQIRAFKTIGKCLLMKPFARQTFFYDAHKKWFAIQRFGTQTLYVNVLFPIL
jgi:hypothetical protein